MYSTRRNFFYLTQIAAFVLILFITYESKKPISQEKNINKNNTVLIVFSVSPLKCPNPIGEEVYNQSFTNKLQYAELKGYDVIYNRRQPRQDITGNYNKISILSEILENETLTETLTGSKRYEWLFWIDYDALFNDMSFDIPFEKYQDANFVAWGSVNRFAMKHTEGTSLSAGVFLLRNNDWSRRFLKEILTFGLDEGRAREREMKRVIRNYERALYEQNAMVYLGKMHPEIREKFYFENRYRINRFWMHGVYSYREPSPFIVHFAGCLFCWISTSNGCIDSWNRYLTLSNQSYFEETRRLNI